MLQTLKNNNDIFLTFPLLSKLNANLNYFSIITLCLL